jgi:fibronectin-binding autotransporter adhesin
MSLLSLISWLGAPKLKPIASLRCPDRRKRRSRGRCVPRVEVLEDRLAPAVLTVNTWVDETTADSYLSLREAINAVNTGTESGLSIAEQAQIVGTVGSNDTIQFDPSLTGQTITLDGSELFISQNLAINGPGANSLTISGGQASRIFEVGSGTTLAISGLTIANGSVHGLGGGILNGGTLTLINSTVTASAEGGGIGNSGTATLINTAVIGNFSEFQGGGIFNVGTLTVIDSSIAGNFGDGGSGIFSQFGALTITDSTITGNGGGLDGGGIDNVGGTVTVTGCTLSGNRVGDTGGGIVNINALNSSGGILSVGTMTVIDSTVTDNSADQGGGIINGGTLTVIDSTLSGNTAGVSGGGGIINYNTLTVIDSTLADNSATSEGATTISGGGIQNWGTATVINSTIVGNYALLQWPYSFGSLFASGGGIANYGTLTVTDSTIVGNSTLFSSNIFSGSLTMEGGGIFNGGTLIIGNTIIAQNTASSGPDVAGPVTSQGYNLVGDGTGATGFAAVSDQQGTDASPIDPLLGPLQDNGGPTQTMAPLPGSPAIDAGSNALAVDTSGNALTSDQRGFPRIVNGTVDIGAVEVQGPTVTALASSTNPSGFGQPVTFTATVSALASGAAPPRGQVTFKDGTTVLAIVSLDGSGRASFTTSVLAAGPHSITATYAGIDTFGSSSASLTQNVTYTFTGFLPPLSQNQTFVLGRPIPVKFRLTDFNGNPVTSLSAVVSLKAAFVNADGSLGAPFALAADGSSALRNDGGQYVFNWRTKGLAAGFYAILLTLADGTVHSNIIELR